MLAEGWRWCWQRSWWCHLCHSHALGTSMLWQRTPPLLWQLLNSSGFTRLYAYQPWDHNGRELPSFVVDSNAFPFGLAGSYSSFEFLSVKTGRLNFVLMYRQPQVSAFFDKFRDFLNEIVDLPGSLYICSNVNCPSTTAGHIDLQLEQIIEDSDLLQHVTVHTSFSP